MNKMKCECGHVNPAGTALCESCGNPLDDSIKQQVLDMRYEGSARRSQTYNKTIIDKIWNFFSSVKVAIWLIVITLIVSALGTIFPQELYIPKTMTPAEYYEQQYGVLGKLYYELGFHNLYSSWWYLLLIGLIGISLVICSIDRAVPLYKALKKQRVTRHESFLKRQRLFSITDEEQLTDKDLTKLIENLKKRRYTIREENGNILAEKGRFSRWGPYVGHIGLIIFLIAAMLRFVPGMYVDEYLWIREGETLVIPGTNGEYYLENKDFILEVYDKEEDKQFSEALDKVGMVAKNFQSDVVLYKKADDSLPGEEAKLEKVKEFSIRVNEPLKFDRFALYQSDYRLNEWKSLTYSLISKKTKKEYGKIEIDLLNPEKTYDLKNGYSVKILAYFPDFIFDEKGQPTTKSKVPNNPAFVFKVTTPETPDGETSFVAIQQTIEPFTDNKYELVLEDIKTNDLTGLTVRKDLTLPLFFVGGIIFMIGLVQGSFWFHRRIWVQRINNQIWMAAHTNKNWHGFNKEIETVLADTGINVPDDQLKEEKQ